MSLPKAVPCPEEGKATCPRIPAVAAEPSTQRRVDALLDAYTADNRRDRNGTPAQ